MQDFSSSSAGGPDGAVAPPVDSAAEAIAEAGRHLWYRLIALALVGTFSLSILVVQLVGAQDGVRTVQVERDRAVTELGVAKGRLDALAGELATAKANRAEQIIATDKDSRRIEGEVAALKAQLAALRAELAAAQAGPRKSRHRAPKPADVPEGGH